MPKSAILNIDRPGSIEQVPFKKLFLLFDRLYVDWMALWLAENDIRESKALTSAEKDCFLGELEILKAWKFLQTYILDPKELRKISPQKEFEYDIQALEQEVQANIIPAKPDESKPAKAGELRFAGVLAANNELIFKMEDIKLRVAALQLGLMHPDTHFVPLLNSFASYRGRQSPDAAVHLVLSKIPVPDDSASWESVLDFRSDPEIQRKYYMLLNWVNEVNCKNLPLSHIADQYNELYHEYLNALRLHRLKSNFTKLELLVLGGIDFISALAHQNYIAAFKGIIHIRKEQVSFLQAERDIPGRELGYIVAANEKFGG